MSKTRIAGARGYDWKYNPKKNPVTKHKVGEFLARRIAEEPEGRLAGQIARRPEGLLAQRLAGEPVRLRRKTRKGRRNIGFPIV